MNIFYDTEFTGLHKGTTLISIGLVDEMGRKFYAEFTDYDKSQINDWILENVIEHLSSNKPFNKGKTGISIFGDKTIVVGDKKLIRNELTKWLNEYDNVQLISDVCHYDMVLFIDIFGDAFSIPKNVNASCHDINQDIAKYYGYSEKQAFDESRETILARGEVTVTGDKHNALYDAMVIKEIYNIINS
jgi:hypothetical protein